MELAGTNHVANDKIWKDHCRNERQAAKTWQQNWNFLKISYQDLVKDEIRIIEQRRQDRINNSEFGQEYITMQYIRPVTPISEYIKIHGSSSGYPKTTAFEVGWRSGDAKCSLEKYSDKNFSKGCILKTLNWPLMGSV